MNDQESGATAVQSIEDRAVDILFGNDSDYESPEIGDSDEQRALASGEEQSNDQGHKQDQSEALEEVELNGKKFKIPTEVKKSLMQEASFTQKSQALAEEKKVFAAQQAQLKVQVEFQSQAMPDIATIQQLDSQISAYKSLDWSQLSSEDMMRYRGALDQLKDKREDAQKQLHQKYQSFEAAKQKTRNELMKHSESYLEKQIAGWGGDVAKELSSYAKNSGFTDAELDAFDNPKLIVQLWKAQQWDKLQAQTSSAKSKASKAPPVVKPGQAFDPKAESQASNRDFKQRFAKAKTPRQREDLLIERFAKDL